MKLDQKLEEKQVQRFANVNVPAVPPRIPPPKVPERIVFPSDDFRKKPKLDRRFKPMPGFDVEIRRKGKFVSIGKAPTKEIAIGKGISATRNTLAASFRVKGAKGYEALAPMFGYRQGKKQPTVLTQFAPTRIKSYGEIREIKQARRGSNKLFRF